MPILSARGSTHVRFDVKNRQSGRITCFPSPRGTFLVLPVPQMSSVWKYVNKTESGQAICKFCAMQYRFAGTTSALRRHLEQKRCKKLPADFSFSGLKRKGNHNIADMNYKRQKATEQRNGGIAELWVNRGLKYDVRRCFVLCEVMTFGLA